MTKRTKSLMGQIFDGPDSIMGKIFGDFEDEEESAPGPEVQTHVERIIAIHMDRAQLAELTVGKKQLEYKAGGLKIRIDLKGD